MKLFLNNQLDGLYYKDDDDILYEFAKSELYQDHTRDEKVRLALFIAYDPPKGLGSTFLGFQFNKLWDYWCANKFTFIGQ